MLNLVDEDIEKERYLYENYSGMLNTAGAKLKILPSYSRTFFYTRASHRPPYSPSEDLAYSFMQPEQNVSQTSDIDDIFKSKLINSKDNIDLLLSQINERDKLKHDNLARIYDDLLRVDQFRAQINFPQKYLKDKTWTDLNSSELRLREQIRREMQASAQDLAFLQNDLRRGLLEYKLQNQKQGMMDDMSIGGTLDELIEPDGSLPIDPGETYEHKPDIQKEMA